jgi:tyrosyl-tRNA synthetase
MLLQAYDFKVLHDKENCRLQIGGSDQWGNITAGGELIRRMRAAHSNAPVEEGPEIFGLTHPLVSKADGTKFGKTESGTIWLDPVRTSPYRFYQFFVQTQDADVMTYLKFFTFLPHEELEKLERAVQIEPEKRLAQVTLAQEVTRLVHGEAELKRAESATQALFGTGIRDLDESTLLDVLGGAPSTQKPKASLEQGLPLIDLLVDTQLCPSKGQARKDLAAGGVYLNNERVADANAVVRAQDLIAGRHLVLRKGKKNYHLVSFG